MKIGTIATAFLNYLQKSINADLTKAQTQQPFQMALLRSRGLHRAFPPSLSHGPTNRRLRLAEFLLVKRLA
jgi:hypothetical protein